MSITLKLTGTDNLQFFCVYEVKFGLMVVLSRARNEWRQRGRGLSERTGMYFDKKMKKEQKYNGYKIKSNTAYNNKK